MFGGILQAGSPLETEPRSPWWQLDDSRADYALSPWARHEDEEEEEEEDEEEDDEEEDDEEEDRADEPPVVREPDEE